MVIWNPRASLFGVLGKTFVPALIPIFRNVSLPILAVCKIISNNFAPRALLWHVGVQTFAHCRMGYVVKLIDLLYEKAGSDFTVASGRQRPSTSFRETATARERNGPDPMMLSLSWKKE